MDLERNTELSQAELLHKLAEMQVNVERYRGEVNALRDQLGVNKAIAATNPATSRRRLLKQMAIGAAGLGAISLTSLTSNKTVQAVTDAEIAVTAEGGADGYGVRASGGLAAIQLVPSTASGAASGLHAAGEIYVDSNNNMYVCVAAGQGTTAVFRKIAGTVNNTGVVGSTPPTVYTAGTLHLLTASDRFVDTRGGAFGGVTGPLVSNTDYTFTIAGVPGRDGSVIPSGATTLVGSLVIIAPAFNGFAKLAPNNPAINLATQGSSTVNFNAGFNTATSFNVGLFGGQVKFRPFVGTGTLNLTIDIVGYYL